jgi:hypothetical protein
MDPKVDIHFTDFFSVSPETLEEYGAFNISLINDLPLFIDPFLLFNSERQEYQQLHDQMIEYLKFLRDKSAQGTIDEGLLKGWFTFSEVKQNWLGYSESGNEGSGLGPKFANALYNNLSEFFSDFGEERVTKGSHLEKLTLIESTRKLLLKSTYKKTFETSFRFRKHASTTRLRFGRLYASTSRGMVRILHS